MKFHSVKMTLSPDSILDAIKKLNKFRSDYATAIATAMLHLENDAASYLDQAISVERVFMDEEDKDVHVSVEETETGFILSMTGTSVGFIEFGTGAYVDEQHMFREKAPFPVFSGSYSDTVGAGTWNAWIMAGKDPNKYPFNNFPQRPLYLTSVWIKEHWAEYFRKEIERIGIS